MIADQCPGVDAEGGVRQLQVGGGVLRQLLQTAAEVVAEVAEQAAGERQLAGIRRFGAAQAGEGGPAAGEEGAAVLAGLGLQAPLGPGAEQVEAAAIGTRSATVQQAGAGSGAHEGETRAGIGVVGQGVNAAGGHG
ncbi:hypothetical protein D3C78_1050360 [compost metagenome]